LKELALGTEPDAFLFMFVPMKYYLILFCSLLLIGLLSSCMGEDRYTKAEDAEDAGREFIRASLDGDMKKAQFYLLQDSVNTMVFDKWKNDKYNKLSPEERMNFKQANILPIRIAPENDSTVNYTYSNTFKNRDTTTVKIVKVNNEWLVDLKAIH
jgi:Domain of unknown function (DUF4878)